MASTTATRPTTATGPEVTYEATLAQTEDGDLQLSLYRTVKGGLCGPWSAPATADGRNLSLADVDAVLGATGYARTTEWTARRSTAGMMLQAQVLPTR